MFCLALVRDMALPAPCEQEFQAWGSPFPCVMKDPTPMLPAFTTVIIDMHAQQQVTARHTKFTPQQTWATSGNSMTHFAAGPQHSLPPELNGSSVYQ